MEILRSDRAGRPAAQTSRHDIPDRDNPDRDNPDQDVAEGNLPEPKVREIRVRCGPLSGVEPLLMREAFEALRRDSPLADAELVIVEERLWAKCLDCGDPFEPERFRLVCPHCGSGRTQIASGDAVILESLVVDAHSPGPARPAGDLAESPPATDRTNGTADRQRA